MAGRVVGEGAGEDLGIVAGGSLSSGLDVRLSDSAAVETAKVGTFVVVHGRCKPVLRHHHGLSLESSDARLASSLGHMDPRCRECSRAPAYSLRRA